ncbi:MAG: spermidine synthase [Spongiibacteraceae bacterium]
MPPSGKEIYRTTDDFGPIQVFDDGEMRFLSFGGDDEQSCQLKAQPLVPQYDYIRAMLLPLLYRRPRDALLLGMGGGALANFLFRHYPSLTLRAVELRPAVIEIAHAFFDVPRDQRLQIIAQDAGDFVRTPGLLPTDLLLCDLYDADGMDERYFQPWFIDICAELVTDNGWLVINCWEDHREDHDTLGAITLHFEEVYTCAVDSGNWIILASRARNPINQARLLAQAATQTKKFGFPVQAYLDRLYQMSGFDDDEED